MGNDRLDSLKPAFAISPEEPRHWKVLVNAIPLEDLLAAYSHLNNTGLQKLEWFTVSHARLGTTYSYGIHPSAPLRDPYDGIWKRERLGGGTVIVPYTEEPGTRQIYVGLLWQWRKLHNPNQPVLGVPRGFINEDDQLPLQADMAQKD